MKKQLILFLCMIMVFLPLLQVSGEADVWTCPNCGREGNARNFCGGCGTPRPSADAVISESEGTSEYEYYPNGDIKAQKYYDASHRLVKKESYNRYGFITVVTEYADHDAQGNALSYTEKFPNHSGKYRVYYYTSKYDGQGNEIWYSYTYADGSSGMSGSAEYNANGKVTSRIYYNADGSIDSSSVDYAYDEDGNLLSYTDLDADGNISGYYTAQWENGIRTGYNRMDAEGNVTIKSTLDQYGDELTYWGLMDDLSTYMQEYVYREDGYQEESWNYDENQAVTWHSISYYSTSGQMISTTSESIRYGYQDKEEYVYDDMGRLAESHYEDRYSSDDISNGTRKYTYDEYDRSIRVLNMRDDGSMFDYYYIYDDKGESHVDYSISQYTDGTKYTTYYHYDDQWRESSREQERISSDGSVSHSTTTYAYDAQNRLISKTTKGDDGYGYIDTYVYDGKDNRYTKTSTYTYSSGSKSETTYIYDAMWRNTEQQIKDTSADGIVESYRRTFQYDTQGRVVKEIWYYPNGNVHRVEETKYDQNGKAETEIKNYREDGSFWY